MNAVTTPRERALVVRDIREFLVSAENLPSPKGTALQLMAIARDPKADVGDAVKVVKSDPALAGFVLRAANSARFGGLVKAVDLHRAVVRLGMNMIRVHAISLSAMGQKPRQACPNFDYPAFWAECLLSGLMAARVASVPVGLLGLARNSIRVRGVIARSIAGMSAP